MYAPPCGFGPPSGSRDKLISAHGFKNPWYNKLYMKPHSGQGAGIPPAALHDALVRTSSHPTVVADRYGHVIEWNRAAEEVTGIPRDGALSRDLWEIQARVAPAHIPYEVAEQRAREQFDELVRLSASDQNEWRRSYVSDLLSLNGAMHHIRSEIFPIWIDNDLAIVSTLWEQDGETRCALDEDYASRVDQLERRICRVVSETGRHSEEVDAYLHLLRNLSPSEERGTTIRLDLVVDRLTALLAVIAPALRITTRISPFLVRPIRGVEIVSLLAELILDGTGPVSVVVRPDSDRSTSVRCVFERSVSAMPERRWIVQDLLNRLDGQLRTQPGAPTSYDVRFPNAILAELPRELQR